MHSTWPANKQHIVMPLFQLCMHACVLFGVWCVDPKHAQCLCMLPGCMHADVLYASLDYQPNPNSLSVPPGLTSACGSQSQRNSRLMTDFLLLGQMRAFASVCAMMMMCKLYNVREGAQATKDMQT